MAEVSVERSDRKGTVNHGYLAVCQDIAIPWSARHWTLLGSSCLLGASVLPCSGELFSLEHTRCRHVFAHCLPWRVALLHFLLGCAGMFSQRRGLHLLRHFK